MFTKIPSNCVSLYLTPNCGVNLRFLQAPSPAPLCPAAILLVRGLEMQGWAPSARINSGLWFVKDNEIFLEKVIKNVCWPGLWRVQHQPLMTAQSKVAMEAVCDAVALALELVLTFHSSNEALKLYQVFFNEKGTKELECMGVPLKKTYNKCITYYIHIHLSNEI